jgi:hypothetical protein
MVKQGNRMQRHYRRDLAFYLFAQVIVFFFACSGALSAPATPAILMGVVTNGAGGTPIVGARVVVSGAHTYSTSGGVYSLAIDPVGTFVVTCAKPGYDTYTSPPVVFQQGVTSLLNIVLWESLTPPASVSANLDSVTQVAGVSWAPPSGNYELLYDDGIQDNFTVWAAQGNMNAVKFTPAGFPVKVTGGSINIGNAGNYPAGSNPLVPFQVSVYDALGPGGAPGSNLAGPFTVAPQALGWVEFTLPLPLLINSGSFYLVMVQVGTPPNTAGIAIDETTPQFRSYARFVTGGSPWYPAGGNFMIRARCEGPGGPPALADQPAIPGSYNVYRLRQGEELNPSAWTLLTSTTGTNYADNGWTALPCGPYRWGIKVLYPGNRWSQVAFSNILGKCWTAPVTIHVNASCQSSGPAGTSVQLVNLAYPDTSYAAICDTSGTVAFPHVWKGTYRVTVSKFAYHPLLQNLAVIAPVTLGLNLLQVKNPPANLVVNDSSLKAHWDVPHYEKPLFAENWSSGSFATHGWTTQGGANWVVSSTLGNPAPCASFIPQPQQINYTQSLVSRTISGERSTLLKLKFDVMFVNLGTTSVNQMAVEIWNGNSWNTLKNYSSTGGTFPWTSEDVDISGYTDKDFKIRFRAYGGDSFDITSWDVDNIDIIASDPAQQQANCILGYYFYLGNVISGYTTKNAYDIPGNQVQYGQTYNACVRALYGSGYSDFACTTFTSHFLYPVRNLHGNPVDNVAFIAWDKPQASYDTLLFTPPGLIGYRVYRDDSLIAQVGNVDSLTFYDYNLEPGLYRYGVSALYDLTTYGYPGQTGESLPAGPLDITITFGRQLPFFESWDYGTFSYNEWRFVPSQGNWVIDPNEGIPSPAASFRWQPPRVNYSYALESPPFNGVPFSCAAIWLDFDLKLSDRNSTGTEKMIVEAYYNHEWHKKAEIKSSANLPWTDYHIDISPVRGKGFRVRFRAAGENSSEILNWYLDNISVYPVCYPATSLNALPAGNAVDLSWSPPACYGGNILDEGFEETFFPPLDWTQQTTNPSATWTHNPASSPMGVHNGNFSAGLNWDYSHQDEWLIAHDIYVNGDLTFWSYAFQGSLHLDHYYLQVSPDQGTTWDVLLDMSALPPYPAASGVNDWITPYHINLSAYAGETVDIAWHAVDGDGNGLWYPWAIDDCSIGADDHFRPVIPGGSGERASDYPDLPAHDLLGYDIYRKAGPSGNFTRINSALVTDTTYHDPGLQTGQYRYFVQSRFAECQNSTNSDTVQVDVITGINNLSGIGLKIFPNPATDHISITSAGDVREVRLLLMTGAVAGSWNTSGRHDVQLDLRGFSRGIYVLQIQLDAEVRNFKICLIHN